MSLRTKQTLSVATGAAPTFTAATASDTMAPGNNVFAVYRNASASTVTVTVVTPGNDPFGTAYTDKAYSLADGSTTPTERWIPLIKEMQDPSTGLVTITCDPITNVTLAVVER
jgi:hypothetical protein